MSSNHRKRSDGNKKSTQKERRFVVIFVAAVRPLSLDRPFLGRRKKRERERERERLKWRRLDDGFCLSRAVQMTRLPLLLSLPLLLPLLIMRPGEQRRVGVSTAKSDVGPANETRTE
jgi:hypothetical protein